MKKSLKITTVLFLFAMFMVLLITPVFADNSETTDKIEIPKQDTEDNSVDIPTPESSGDIDSEILVDPDKEFTVAPETPKDRAADNTTDSLASLQSIDSTLKIFVYFILPAIGAFYVIKHFIFAPFKQYVS